MDFNDSLIILNKEKKKAQQIKNSRNYVFDIYST